MKQKVIMYIGAILCIALLVLGMKYESLKEYAVIAPFIYFLILLPFEIGKRHKKYENVFRGILVFFILLSIILLYLPIHINVLYLKISVSCCMVGGLILVIRNLINACKEKNRRVLIGSSMQLALYIFIFYSLIKLFQ